PSRRVARIAIMILSRQSLGKRCAATLSEFLKFLSQSCWRNVIKNFGASVSFPKAKPVWPRPAFDVMFGGCGKAVGTYWLGALAAVTFAHAGSAASEFRFDRDTFAFANQTVFEYHEGHASLRKPSATKRDAYNRHCFVMCRTAAQFKKFARFDSPSTPLDNASLAARIRAVTRQAAW